MNTHPSVLHIPIVRKYFDAIREGSKKEEFRDFTDFWCSRLMLKDEQGEYRDWKPYDVVRFRNGYTASSPVIEVEYKGAELLEYPEQPEHSPYRLGFAIHLGEVLRTENL